MYYKHYIKILKTTNLHIIQLQYKQKNSERYIFNL